MKEIVSYAIFYSALHTEDTEYVKDLEKRMESKNFIPTKEDRGYLVALDKEGKIIYEFNSEDNCMTSCELKEALE